MVLVDPSIPDLFTRLQTTAPAFITAMQYIAASVAYLDRWLAGMKSGAIKLGGEDPEGCLAYPGYPRELSTALATLDTNPLRFTTAQSLFRNFEPDGKQVVNPSRNFGDMPLLVLTSTKVGELPKDTSAKVIAQQPAMQALIGRGHDELAALSLGGVNRRVADSGHYIQYDQPQAVIDAVIEVVEAARSKSGAPTTAKHH